MIEVDYENIPCSKCLAYSPCWRKMPLHLSYICSSKLPFSSWHWIPHPPTPNTKSFGITLHSFSLLPPQWPPTGQDKELVWSWTRVYCPNFYSSQKPQVWPQLFWSSDYPSCFKANYPQTLLPCHRDLQPFLSPLILLRIPLWLQQT